MQIAVFGAGYLGTVVSACLADMGTPVTCCDTDSELILELARGKVPFYEKNLEEVLKRNVRAGRLTYSTAVESEVTRSQVVFIAQDGPGETEEVALRIARAASPDTILVICTPSPVGTAARVSSLMEAAGCKQAIISHPLSLTDGCAVEDFNWPDRLLMGARSNLAVASLKHIYRPLVMRGIPVIVTSFETAELAREAATAFVATKISFINELSSLCESVNADAVDLAMALGLDKRIAPRCLQAGVRMGGRFVQCDMDALDSLARANGVSLSVLSAAREVNCSFTDSILQKISTVMESLRDKQLALLGLAFKPHTSSVDGSSAIALARGLTQRGAQVRAYDPFAMNFAERELCGNVRFCDSAYTAAEGVDALVVGTGWPEFRSLDFERLKTLLRRPLIVDTKNLLDSERLRSMGFQYLGVGRA